MSSPDFTIVVLIDTGSKAMGMKTLDELMR
jgi:hypothetical protein